MASAGAGSGEFSVGSDPDFATVCSFLQIFGPACAIDSPSISDLQRLLEDTQEVATVLQDLHLKLLRRAVKSVKPERWERALIKFCHELGLHKEAWELERFTYKKASSRVKLTLLKVLLEYQFTCHAKFKNGVNALPSSQLRLEPVGRDRAGRVYWLHTDAAADLRLYREDQDEETWSLIARDREGLVKVIGQLKSGEDSETVDETLLNEDSLETSPSAPEKKCEGDDSNEEFLSPESESDNESDTNPNHKHEKSKKLATSINDELKKEVESDTNVNSNYNSTPPNQSKAENLESEVKPKNSEDGAQQTENEDDSSVKKNSEKSITMEINEASNKTEPDTSSDKTTEETVGEAIEEPVMLVTGEGNGEDCEGFWDEISEPVMFVWGAGCGAPCSTGNPGETTTELGGSEEGFNNTDHPAGELSPNKSCENLNTANNGENVSDLDSNIKSNIKENDILGNCNEKLKIENHQPITKRGLQEASDSKVSEQKQVESTPKKPCIWNVESMVKKSEINDDSIPDKGNKTANKNYKSEENGSKNDDQTTTTRNSNAEESGPARKCKKNNDLKDDLCVSENVIANSVECSKINIIEKRKSSISSEDEKKPAPLGDENSSQPCEKQSGKHKAKPRSKGGSKSICKPEVESLPPKKSRLDSSTDDCDRESSENLHLYGSNIRTDNDFIPSIKESHSPDNSNNKCNAEVNESEDSGIKPKPKVDDIGNVIEKEVAIENAENKENSDEAKVLVPLRNIKKVKRGKFKRRLLKKSEKKEESVADSDSDKNLDELANKQKQINNQAAKIDECKSLKRGLQPEKRKRNQNKEESVSEEENEELVIGKRLKIKPKKVLLSSRKKVEEQINNRKDSSEDSEEIEVTPKRGKTKRCSSPKKEAKGRSSKKKKKKRGSEGKSKKSRGEGGSAEDVSPVRQSRRIAQLKIREEAERRQMEEVALRELKMKHKKTKTEEGSEEWRASGASSGSEEGGGRRGAARGKRRGDKWPASETSQPSSGSDTDEPLFDRDYEEPDLEFKSDHEFSPESDLEDDPTAEPIKRARTLKEEAEGFCVRCSRGDQPEWILLCDDCDAGYHASCLKPILFLVPDGDWFCPPCQHKRLIAALEEQLVKFDELARVAGIEKSRRKELELEAQRKAEEEQRRRPAATGEGEEEDSSSSSEWSSSDEGTVYRLRERRQLPVSLRAQEYDRLMSSAIKEEYKEPESAGNQGRGKDISTIIEAAEEEKQRAELEAQQGGGVECEGKRSKPRRPRRKPRKLNSLDVPSEDEDDTDEDYKEAGCATSSESISSEGEGDTRSDSRSSDSLPVRRSGRDGKKSRKKIVESPELKKKKGVFDETSSESSGTKDWSKKKKSPTKSRFDKTFSKKPKKKKGLKQYDAEGNVIKPRVKYGGLSGSEGSNDWSPKHRTRQKKINYTEMPNTESEDEVHKPSGKHMPDSSDEYKLSEDSSDSEAGRRRGVAEGAEAAGAGAAAERTLDEEKVNTLRELVKKTAVVPLHKLPEDITRAKTEALEAQLNARAEAAVGTATPARAGRGRGGRGGRGSRGPRGGGGGGAGAGSGRGGGAAGTSTGPDAVDKLVGVKIKDLSQADVPPTPNQVEREKKRVEREARLVEKEARKLERLRKKEEKEQLKEQRAKEREEKRAAREALTESRRQRRDKLDGLPAAAAAVPTDINHQFAEFQRMRQAGGYRPAAGEQQHAPAPRLQVRPELRAMRPDLANVRAQHPHQPHQPHHPSHPHHQPPHPHHQQHYPPPPHMQRDVAAPHREGTLSVAGSPQPFKPATDPPSIITRMPHMIPPQYRGGPMYMAGPPYGPPPPGARPPPHMMYMHPPHPLDPSASSGAPLHMNSRHPYPGPPPGGAGPGYYPRGYPPPRFPPPPGEPHASTSAPPPPHEPKIKSEIKTEPEAAAAGSPSSSPARLTPPPPQPAAPPAPPHPKLKHTESKERARSTAAARYPHGPYAPQYAAYGPYGPPHGPHGPPPPGPDTYGPLPHAMPRAVHAPPGAHRMPPPPHHHPAPPHLHGPPPPLRHAPPPHHQPPPPHHQPPPPHRMPAHVGALPHRPPSPMTALHPTAAPARRTPDATQRTPDAVQRPPKSSAPDPVDSVAAHERLRSPPPQQQPSPAADREPRPVELTVSTAAQLTPMEPAGKAPAPAAAAEVEVERDAAAAAVTAARAPHEEGGGVFGGLVSYFSSQQEDDLDG